MFALAFAPRSARYPGGLYATGDTDNDGPHWGRFAAGGSGTPFSEVPGVQGITFVLASPLAGMLLAARPDGGGFAGENEITRIASSGELGEALATNLPGVHAVTSSPGGALGTDIYAATWGNGRVWRIPPVRVGTSTPQEILQGLDVNASIANSIAVSPDGNALFVADRNRNRVLCVDRAPL